ncbi:MAG: cob(I)yrinic acid a,c-diamide adenosyltransferase [Acidobacteria bacterium]|nr:cob(I)yrinic acid a,c-diamide adenosyltransferase [Acidobacteriota bacterium]
MSEGKIYHAPHVALNRIYTRRGDGGQTSLVGGQRVGKDALRIECYGTVDELNSFVGMARFTAAADSRLDWLEAILLRVQHELFNLGSILATLPEDVHPKQPRVTQSEIDRLEREIDLANEPLSGLRSFVLPGGSRINTELHAARTVCRRAERIAVALAKEEPVPAETIGYLNRLSDALFVWSRWANFASGAPEVLWDPNHGAG